MCKTNPLLKACFAVSLLSVFCFLFVQMVCSQGILDSLAAPSRESSIDRSLAVRVFIDCARCDMDYIKSEMLYVNYVRDRHDAEVHILVTTQRTGSGGTEHTATFIGKLKYTGINDTLSYLSRESDTEETVRAGVVRVIKLGLMQYVAKTPLAEHITISFSHKGRPSEVADPWDYWVFKTSLNAYLNGEKSSSYLSLYGSVSANRVTPELKLNLSAYGNYDENTFDIEDQTILSVSRSKGIDTYVVFSLDEHWSAGVSSSLSSSTYQNTDFALRAGPAVECNLFPYSESTRRQLRFEYRIRYQHFQYEEETIFDKISEDLVSSSLAVTVELKQSWGSVEASLEGSHYVHDVRKNRLQLFGQLSLRLIEGFSLSLYGSGSMIHDQISLPKRGASPEEILLRRRQLATQFRYFGSVGLSYTFGSIYSNVVNPRFGN